MVPHAVTVLVPPLAEVGVATSTIHAVVDLIVLTM